MGTKGARYSEEVGRFAEELVDVLAEIGDVSWKRMFGGAGIFLEGSMFGLIDPAVRLHLKAGEADLEAFEAKGSKKHPRMPYYSVPEDVLADDSELIGWARRAASVDLG